jgi:multidrug efflux pump subunit AcrB
MKGILAAFARNTVFANIVLVMIFVAGGISAVNMIREIFPQFSLDIITIAVPYPGADPEEVEEGINQKIEEALEGLEGIKQYNTTAMENRSSCYIEVKENYDIREVLDRVRSKIDSISNFPLDAEKPIITELLLKDQVISIAVSGNMNERRIKEWSEVIKDELQLIPDISQVYIYGTRDYEISIEVSEEKLREYGLTFAQVSQAVRRSSLNMAGGTIRTLGEEIRVRTMGRKYSGKELASIVVVAHPQGETITLDRLATIVDGFSEDPIKATLNGESTVILTIFKTPEEDSLAISKAVDEYVKEKSMQLPEGARITTVLDLSDMLRDRISLLVRNGLIGLIIVFFLLWIFLDIRLSFWGGMGMPISIAGAMAILWATGGTINMISLFGLIMVLGIVVDDAIVVGEAIYVHRKRGEPPLRAAVEGVCEVGMPVFAAVATSIVAFIPLAFVGGIMGKFISILPIVVVACLSISLVECLILLPAHLSHLPDPNIIGKSRNPLSRWIGHFHHFTSSGLEWFIAHIYSAFLKKALQWRYVSFCVAISVLFLSIGLIKGGVLKFAIFPDIDGFTITSTVEFPNGTPPQVTRDAIERIEAALHRVADSTTTLTGEPMIENCITLVGKTLQEIPLSGPNVGSVQAILLDSERRGLHTNDLKVLWKEEIGEIPGIQSLIFEGLAAGPPGAPIEVWLQARDMETILAAADDLQEKLSSFEGVYQISSDFRPGKNELRLKLKPQARTLGLTVDDLARQVYAGYYGEEAFRLQRGRDDIRVKVRYTADERSRISNLEHVRIRTQSGMEVPLYSVAEASFSPGYSTITRTDGMRRVTVSAEVDSNRANANEVIMALNAGDDDSGNYFDELKIRYPGLNVSLQGEQKKMQESFGSLFIGFPLALLGMFIIIATVFRSYLQPLVIMFTVPFGVVGAIMGHLLMGFDLSIMSIFGIVALSGVVVNDAIVLIERINTNLADGIPFFEAIRKGGVRRFRAVFLTSLSTVGGLMPLILETDLQAQFLIPMALSVAAGVAFATVLTLVLIPSLLVILNDQRCLWHLARRGHWPSREQVEPASERNLNLMGD